jgi:hypothetical protein
MAEITRNGEQVEKKAGTQARAMTSLTVKELPKNSTHPFTISPISTN